MLSAVSVPRVAIRICVECPVRVRDAVNAVPLLQVNARVVRIWPTGLYMYATTALRVAVRVFMVVPLPFGARVAVRGYVTRVEPQGDVQFGVNVQFTRTRLLPGEEAGG